MVKGVRNLGYKSEWAGERDTQGQGQGTDQVLCLFWMGHSPGTSRYSSKQILLNLNPIPSGTTLSPVISLAHKRLSLQQSSLEHLEWSGVDIRYVFLCDCTTHLTLDLLANPSSNTPPLLSDWNLPNCDPSSSLSPGTLASPLGLWSGPKTHLVIKIKLSLASVPSLLPCLLCDTTGGCGI